MKGEVEKEDGVLVIKRVHVRYRLVADAADVEAAQRAHEMHHSFCPVYKTLEACVDMTTDLEVVAPG